MTARTLRPADLELGPPQLPIPAVAGEARRHFPVEGDPRRLPGERDLNLLFDTGPEPRLLKVSSAAERADVVDLQIEALRHLEHHAPELPVPRMVPTREGAWSARFNGPEGSTHAMRMLTFVPGRPFAGDPGPGVDALTAVGRAVGGLARALAGFDHRAADHFVLWDISNGVLAADQLWATAGNDVADRARHQRGRLAEQVLPALAELRNQVVHNDAHGGNVLRGPGSSEVVGIIDFGDMVRAPLLNDLAICGSGFIRNDRLDAVDAVAALARGYHHAHPLEVTEVALLFDAVLARLVLTLLLFDHQIHHATGHAAYSRAERPAALGDLDAWLAHDPSAATDRFMQAVNP